AGAAVVGVAGPDPRRDLQLAAAVLALQHADLGPAALAAGPPVVAHDAELLARRRADECGVVPAEGADRLGQLLEPAVVGEPAVEEGRVGAEVDLVLAGGRRGGAELLGPVAGQRRVRLAGQGTAGDHARPHRLLPERLELAGLLGVAEPLPPERPDDLAALGRRDGAALGAGRRPARVAADRRDELE